MTRWKTLRAILMVALFALTGPLALAQDPGAAPPPRVVGAVEIDKLTQAPLRLVRSVSLDAAPTEVFHFVTDSQNWPGLSPSIESVSVRGNGRVGSTRTLMLGGGVAIAEHIVAFNEPGSSGVASFAYSVAADNPYGVQGHLAVLELRPADGGGTVLNYHQFFDHPELSSILPQVSAGTDQIVSKILYRFGGELRGRSGGQIAMTIEAERVVDVSSARAWEVLATAWGEVDEWASLIAHSASQGGNASSLEGATRSCEVPGTPGFREAMTAFDEEALTLTYRVLEGMPPFVTKAESTWKIKAITDQKVLVSSRIAVEVAPGTPAFASSMLLGQFTQILDLTADELEHFLETDRPHPRKLAAMGGAATSQSGR